MIEQITIKNIATFNAEGVQINNLKKVNFIYGANASGKTTISNFLHNQEDGKYNSCSIEWNNNIRFHILVYNKDFRERNFGKGKIAGVFTLGQATKEEKEEIEQKTETLKKIRDESAQKKTTKENQETQKKTLEDTFKETCWTKIYKKYENDFKEAFKGSINSKDNFKSKLLQEFANNQSLFVSIDELKEKAKTIFGGQPQHIDLISNIVFDRIIEIENDEIWNKIIVGKADVDIAKLINRLNINDWVNQGRNYLQEDEICPFCQQKTITDDFKKQIEQFFDETYLNEIKTLKDFKSEYETLTQNIINELNTLEQNQKNFKYTKLDIDKFSSYLKTLTSQIATNKEYLTSKEKEPSRQFTLTSLKEQLELVTVLITTANNEIQRHNDIVTNFNTEKANLIKSVWKFIVESNRLDIEGFNRNKNGLETGITKLNGELETKRKEYKDLDDKIKKLNKNVTSIQPTIDEINRLLKAFGFLNFEIVKANEDGFYKIQREDGSIADSTLSEGETTFITFLYFLQLAKGGVSEEKVNEERVLVIDDPISSLDSNVLFVVGSLIKEIIKDIKTDKGQIKQIILLTHNIYFHKEVSFIDGREKQNNKTHYWILRKNDNVSAIQQFEQKNPISSSYELLWQELKNNEIKSCTTIQNIMRRIIEYYFKLLGKYGDDDLINKFTTKEEQDICRSLICWINDGSHSINDDLYIELQDLTVDKYKTVFQNIFNHTENKGHYNMMMGVNEYESNSQEK
jgi:wobble nucleotide-excising tRNase